MIAAPSFQRGGDVIDSVDGSGNATSTKYDDYGGGGFLALKYGLPDFFSIDGGAEFYISGGFGTGAGQNSDTDLDNYAVDDFSVLAGLQGMLR